MTAWPLWGIALLAVVLLMAAWLAWRLSVEDEYPDDVATGRSSVKVYPPAYDWDREQHR